ncbi:MAG: methanogenesis marker 14 protein [Methanocalculus sp. MSAO_Arc1]|uniref:methanogenesis marker 14 protein n=1 Tax=Methanocalculus TaxID=71151 RepID=UPI000FF76EC5|nr:MULTISPECIES: methanogenesis marker 14 protein [unclassified Methanocalculus]MCP1662829.1 putative methanogenesis marker protein 14 [Methanocalculus sp. AMF5]RQD79007.1 MAG: methanogenesis marker 14 protein [Methanocalculus sp. MSAO_Arc1]
MCAGFLKRFFPVKPHIVYSPPPPSITHVAGMQMPEYKNKPYFIVASVEMGNTTTKCILTGTSLETGTCYVINKTVSMSRDVRQPKPGEEIFGATLDGTKLTRESVTELVRDTLLQCHRDVKLSVKDDLDFVVRSTGVVAAMESPDQIGDFIIALANGCLEAGVPPRKMTPPMSVDNLPPKLREHSFADRLVFTGAVAGVVPPVGSTGIEMVANEMEGELAMAGIKEGAKWTPVDFRNPCISLDFGTTLDGRITSDVSRDAENPFAKTIGNFCGLAGAIPDAIIRGTGLVEGRTGTALDVFGEDNSGGGLSLGINKKAVQEYVDRCHEEIDIRIVPRDRRRFGRVPVYADVAEESGVALVGCDCGVDGDGIDNLKSLGAEMYRKYRLSFVTEVVDRVCAGMALRMIDVCIENDLVPENSSIGFTGRAVISGRKPGYILEGIEERRIYTNPVDHLVFVDDGLARGAALMGRCMNSLGKPKNPLGGVRGGPCIMAKRIKIGR